MMLKLTPTNVHKTSMTTAVVRGMIKTATSVRMAREKREVATERNLRESRTPTQESQEDAELRKSLAAALGNDEGEDV